jgi:predicted nucleic acid-binding protein
MGLTTYFFDTYALLESIRENKSYQCIGEVSMITTRLNLMELYYILMRNHNRQIAEHYFDMFRQFAVDFEDALIKEAMQFRLDNKSKDLSYIDCIGYVLAARRGVRFLTGDDAFKGLPNVEFVK